MESQNRHTATSHRATDDWEKVRESLKVGEVDTGRHFWRWVAAWVILFVGLFWAGTQDKRIDPGSQRPTHPTTTIETKIGDGLVVTR